MKLWDLQTNTEFDQIAAIFNDSLPFDKRLAMVDILASQKWAAALLRAGIIEKNEENLIQIGLNKIKDEFQNNIFVFDPSDEDIHTAVERRLVGLIGPVGGKLHTGRSRNDQVATDFRLWVIMTNQKLLNGLTGLQQTLIQRAERDMGIILPGYTHLQQAQPILLSHWWLAHFWALERDKQRLVQISQNVKVMPLGSGALAGSGFPIDRFKLAKDLGFCKPSENSLDAVSDRDFAVEFLFWAALLSVHLSRMGEALVIYSTKEFGFIKLHDSFSTGSSLMPQKRNPDPLEMTRGKCGFFISRLTGLLATLKGLPSAYDKDLQEDKQPVFEAADTMSTILTVLMGLISTLQVDDQKMQAGLEWSTLSTDLADYLVRKGVPFRQAHHELALINRKCEELQLTFT